MNICHLSFTAVCITYLPSSKIVDIFHTAENVFREGWDFNFTLNRGLDQLQFGNSVGCHYLHIAFFTQYLIFFLLSLCLSFFLLFSLLIYLLISCLSTKLLHGTCVAKTASTREQGPVQSREEP